MNLQMETVLQEYQNRVAELTHEIILLKAALSEKQAEDVKTEE